MLHTVEGGEGCAFGAPAHYDFLAVDFGEVKAVEGLAYGVEDVVGDIDHRVDGAKSYGVEAVLEPVGALGHLDAADGDAAVAGACLGVSHLYGHGAVFAVNGERVDRRTFECQRSGMLRGPCCEVAGHSEV